MNTKNVPKEVMDWETKFARCAQARQSFEEQWYYNMAFYFGRQWAIWDKNALANRLIEPPAPRNRVRLTTNKIKPIIRREITKLTKAEPQAYVVPNTTEPTDIAAAKVAENLADWCFTTYNYNKARRTSTFWMTLTGIGITKVTCPEANGDILYEPVIPFHFYVPYIQEENLQSQPYVIHARGYSPEAVYEKYGVEVRPDATTSGSTLEQRLFSAMGIKNTAGQQALSVVKEIWVKPCKNYPEGGLLVIADRKVIYAYDSKPKEPIEPEGNSLDAPVVTSLLGNVSTWSQCDFPFEHNEYPFWKMDHIPTGQFYADSVIKDLIPLQKEYNRSRSQVIESKNRTSKPQMAYIKGSIDATKVTSEPGLMIPVNPGFEKPEYLRQPEIPGYVIQEFDRMQRDIDDVSNQFEVAKGRTPPGVEAASAIAYLQEENDDVLYTTIASIEDATTGIGRHTLSLVQQFWDESKIVKVVSRNNSLEAKLFKISSINDNTDFRIEPQSMAPRSRAARQAFIVDLMDKGVLLPEQGLRYLQMSETNRLYDELQVDSRQARRENILMATGQVGIETDFMPNAYDNHATHLYEHELFMKSQEYEALPDEIKSIFLTHHMVTKMMVQGQMMEQAMQGQPPVATDPTQTGETENVG